MFPIMALRSIGSRRVAINWWNGCLPFRKYWPLYFPLFDPGNQYSPCFHFEEVFCFHWSMSVHFSNYLRYTPTPFYTFKCMLITFNYFIYIKHYFQCCKILYMLHTSNPDAIVGIYIIYYISYNHLLLFFLVYLLISSVCFVYLQSILFRD
jgi:hypothetical protein